MEPLAELLGRSAGIAAVRDQVIRVLRAWSSSRRPPPVLFQGETGTGKGLVARALHRSSPRANGPFVDVNCAAMPETLIEAELFGYEAGAFTDARRTKAGLVQLASRGTLFLDEIGLLPWGLQAKLLSVLEDRAVRRLGSTRQEPVDLWLITATNENMTAAVRSGNFREDLFHRIAVITITLPPLRERGDDILILGKHFLDKVCVDYGLPPKSLAPDAQAALRAYPWPGNVRELGNVIERVALLADAMTITATDLGSIGDASSLRHRSAPEKRVPRPVASSHDVMREHLLAVLTETGWNISHTAAALGVSRNTVHARIARYGLRATSTGARPAVPPRIGAGAPPPRTTAPAAPHWQPRRLTLLRVRLTRPSEVEGAVPPTLNLIEEKILGFGGHVEDVSPDGVLAVFGLESVAEPAVVAAHGALAVRNAARQGQLSSEAGRPVTIALHTAELMVNLGGGAAEIDADGSRAARDVLEALLDQADADTTVVSEPAAALLRRRFLFAPLGAERRGYRLEGLWHAAAGGHHDTAPLVDRAEELALLEGRLGLAAQGIGQVVDVIGDAGIGKSRLIQALAARAPLGRVLYLEGRCSPAMASTPFHPILSILRGACDIGESDPPEIVSQRAAAAAAAGGLDPAILTPALVDLLMSTPAEAPDADPAIVKRRLFAAIEQLLLGRSLATPLLIAVEDLHWIDASSEECLARLVQATGSAPILLVCTYRLGYHPPWAGHSNVTQLALPPLSSEDSRVVVQGVLETSASDEIIRTILARAEGNPLFLEELSLIAREPGGDRTPTSMPATIEEVISTRIDRLRSRPRQLLVTAAVIGRDVPLELLDRVSDFPADTLEETLEQLRRGDFLYRTIRPHTEPSYVFRHTLVQDVAYQATPPAERRRLHERVVTELERLSGRGLADHAERLGDHAYEGQLWEQAVVYLEKAGVRAALRSAGREAAARFERALQALAHLPDSRANLERGIELRLKLRNPLFLLADFRRALAMLGEVVTLADSLHARAQAGTACAFMANAHFMLGNLDDGIRLADRARAMGDALGDPLLLAISCCHLGQLRYARGEYPASIGMMQRCLKHLEAAASRRRSNTVRVYSVVAHCFIAFALGAVGRFDEAAASSARCVELAQKTETPFLRTLATWSRGNVALARGAGAEAAAALDEAHRQCQSSELLAIRPWIATDLGWAHALLGHGSEALELLSVAVREAASRELLSQHSLRLAYLAEVQLDAGQEVEATQTAAQALELAVARGESGFRVIALRARARVAAQRREPDLDAAEGYLRQALALGETLGMRPAVAHCHVDLAGVSRRAGRSEDAAGHQRAAEALYIDLDTPSWRERLARDT
jgi:DNA-binding NtrC family response regulator/tetratricopeptide (TPR) repeat protein